MNAFLADVGGLARCQLTIIEATWGVVRAREQLPVGHRGTLTLTNGQDCTEMTAVIEFVGGACGYSRFRILAWETDEDAPLLLVARERMVH